MIQAIGNKLFLYPADTIGPPQQIHRCRRCDGALLMNTENNQGKKLLMIKCVNCGNYKERVYQFRSVRVAVVQAKHSVPCRVIDCDNKTIPKPGGNGLCPGCNRLNNIWNSSLKKLPAPFIVEGDVWRKNPARKKKKQLQ